eukprot:Nk52_evm49s1737 gene=Nk52_evmTU49s1737
MLVKLLFNDGAFDESRGKRMTFDEDVDRFIFAEKCYHKLVPKDEDRIPLHSNDSKRLNDFVKLYYMDGEQLKPKDNDDWCVFIESCKAIVKDHGEVLKLVVDTNIGNSIGYIPPTAKTMSNSRRSSLHDNSKEKKQRKRTDSAHERKKSLEKDMRRTTLVRRQSQEALEVTSLGQALNASRRGARPPSFNFADNNFGKNDYAPGSPLHGNSSFGTYHKDSISPLSSPMGSQTEFNLGALNKANMPSHNPHTKQTCSYCSMSFVDPRHPVSKYCDKVPAHYPANERGADPTGKMAPNETFVEAMEALKRFAVDDGDRDEVKNKNDTNLPCAFCLKKPYEEGTMLQRCPNCVGAMLPHLNKEEQKTILNVLNK